MEKIVNADGSDAICPASAACAKSIRSYQESYSLGEEIANAVTHGIGVGLSIVALVLLVVRAVHYTPADLTARYVVGFSVFCSSLIVLYLCSTLYHALPRGAKYVFGVIDHCCIYVLIAGTYTASCLTTLYGAIGWTVFGVIWGLACSGSVIYSVFGHRVRWLSLVMYIAMGWLVVFVAKPLRERLPEISFLFLVLGGVLYTVGCVFYALKRIKWTHTIWHMFVIGGSVMHFFSLYLSF